MEKTLAPVALHVVVPKAALAVLVALVLENRPDLQAEVIEKEPPEEIQNILRLREINVAFAGAGLHIDLHRTDLQEIFDSIGFVDSFRNTHICGRAVARHRRRLFQMERRIILLKNKPERILLSVLKAFSLNIRSICTDTNDPVGTCALTRTADLRAVQIDLHVSDNKGRPEIGIKAKMVFKKAVKRCVPHIVRVVKQRVRKGDRDNRFLYRLNRESRDRQHAERHQHRQQDGQDFFLWFSFDISPFKKFIYTKSPVNPSGRTALHCTNTRLKKGVVTLLTD
ncbi:MAG: hypothetical protein IJL52_09165 [Clostridia bacterium]|nr:hypothetical protein [Clostridia bacterium]